MVKKSSVYTKKGDRGKTFLIGGACVDKNHPRIEAYGTVDELMAHTALLRDLVDDPGIREDLLNILDVLMITASRLAADSEEFRKDLPVLERDRVEFLEQRMDEMDASLPPLSSFVLPGGHPAISQAHVSRTVCRRAERILTDLSQHTGVEDIIIQYYNRLSDYFFVLSRKLSDILGIEQKPWKPVL